MPNNKNGNAPETQSKTKSEQYLEKLAAFEERLDKITQEELNKSVAVQETTVNGKRYSKLYYALARDMGKEYYELFKLNRDIHEETGEYMEEGRQTQAFLKAADKLGAGFWMGISVAVPDELVKTQLEKTRDALDRYTGPDDSGQVLENLKITLGAIKRNVDPGQHYDAFEKLYLETEDKVGKDALKAAGLSFKDPAVKNLAFRIHVGKLETMIENYNRIGVIREDFGKFAEVIKSVMDSEKNKEGEFFDADRRNAAFLAVSKKTGSDFWNEFEFVPKVVVDDQTKAFSVLMQMPAKEMDGSYLVERFERLVEMAAKVPESEEKPNPRTFEKFYKDIKERYGEKILEGLFKSDAIDKVAPSVAQSYRETQEQERVTAEQARRENAVKKEIVENGFIFRDRLKTLRDKKDELFPDKNVCVFLTKMTNHTAHLKNYANGRVADVLPDAVFKDVAETYPEQAAMLREKLSQAEPGSKNHENYFKMLISCQSLRALSQLYTGKSDAAQENANDPVKSMLTTFREEMGRVSKFGRNSGVYKNMMESMDKVIAGTGTLKDLSEKMVVYQEARKAFFFDGPLTKVGQYRMDMVTRIQLFVNSVGGKNYEAMKDRATANTVDTNAQPNSAANDGRARMQNKQVNSVIDTYEGYAKDGTLGKSYCEAVVEIATEANLTSAQLSCLEKLDPSVLKILEEGGIEKEAFKTNVIEYALGMPEASGEVSNPTDAVNLEQGVQEIQGQEIQAQGI